MKYLTLIVFAVFTNIVYGQTVTQTQTINGYVQTQTVTFSVTGDTSSLYVGATRVYDCGVIGAGIDSSFTITVTGAVVGNPVITGLTALPEQGLAVHAWCVTANVVTVVLSNRTNNVLNPSSKTFKVSQRIL